MTIEQDFEMLRTRWGSEDFFAALSRIEAEVGDCMGTIASELERAWGSGMTETNYDPAPWQDEAKNLRAEIERLRAELASWQEIAEGREEAQEKAEAEVERLTLENFDLTQEVKHLRAAGSEFVVAFEQRFKPTGIEDEFAALRQAIGEEK